MFKKEVSYEFSREGLKQMREDNKRDADVQKLYEVMATCLTTMFIAFLV